MRSTLKVDEIRLRLFLLQVSENVTQPRPRPFAAENVSSCAPIAEGNLLARASPFGEYLGRMQRKIEGRGKPPATTESTNKNVSCRKSERKDRRRTLSTLSKLQITQKSSTSGSSIKRGLYETALDCSAYLVEKLTDQPVLKVANYFVELVPEAELGRSKKEIFSTKMEAEELMWECQAQATLRYWFGSTRARKKFKIVVRLQQ